MPCHVRSTRSSRRRRKSAPSLLRQVRLLKRLSARELQAKPTTPSSGSDDPAAP